MNLIRLIKPCTWYHRVFHRLYPMPFLWSVSSHFVVGLEGVHKMTTAFLAVIYQSSVVDTFLALTYPPDEQLRHSSQIFIYYLSFLSVQVEHTSDRCR